MTVQDPKPAGETGEGPKPAGERSGGGPKPAGESSGATFTQDQVDQFVAEAKRKEAERFPEYDSMRKRLAELENASKTELERATTAAQEASSRADAAVTERNRLIVREALVTEAARAGCADPEIAVALLAEEVTVDSEGKVERERVKRLVAKLLEDRPFLRNGQPTGHGSADGGTRGRQTTPSPVDRMNDLIRGG